jgi:4'-phosphopantetheinyl transferase EntD
MTADWPSITNLTSDAVLVIDLLDRCQDPLMAAEAELANNVTNSRLRELKAGRSTARHALRLLGIEPVPILLTPGGAPAWPREICGSLSHSHRHIAVLLAHSSCYQSVGIDIEDGRSLGVSTSTTVVTARELQAIDRAGWKVPGSTAEGIAFSAKEAVFKCQFPMTLDASLNFLDVRLELGSSPQTLGIQLVDDSERPTLTSLADRIHIHALSAFGVTVVYAFLDRQGAGPQNIV